MMKRFDLQKQQQIAWWLLILVMLIYTVEMSHQAVLRYDTFKATAFDLGNMDQVFWNTIHGRWFQYTNQAIDYYGPPTRLAQHFEPIILPLSLLYVFHADPRILLVFQTLVLVSGALPVFLLTRRYLPEWPILAALMVMAYLLSPALLGLNIFDFHPVSLATPLLLYAMLALTYKRYGWFIIACILAASCKEDIPLTIAMLGLFLIWKYRLPRLGIALTIGGFLWSFIAFFVIIPHFYPGTQGNNFWYRYEALGSTPTTALGNIILHPWLLFTTLVTLDRLYYLASLLRSTGFLCLLAPEWLLLALPGLGENLLSTDPLIYSGIYHYNAAIIPFVILSAIHGTRRLISLWQGWRGEKSGHREVWETTSSSRGPGDPNIPALSASRRFVARLVQWVSRRSLCLRFTRIVKAWYSSLSLWRNVHWLRFSERMVPLAKSVPLLRLQWTAFAWITIMIGLNFLLATPFLNNFWANHAPGSREQHIQQLLEMIPPNASVSASSNINPHVSEREHLAVFPSISDSGQTSGDTVQYIIVDLYAIFPEDRASTINELNHLRRSGQYTEIALAQGVELLRRAP